MCLAHDKLPTMHQHKIKEKESFSFEMWKRDVREQVQTRLCEVLLKIQTHH